MKRNPKRGIPVRFKGTIVGSIKHLSYEEQYPTDMLFHPSPSLKRIEKMILKEDFNPSRRKQRDINQILDDTDADFDNENDT